MSAPEHERTEPWWIPGSSTGAATSGCPSTRAPTRARCCPTRRARSGGAWCSRRACCPAGTAASSSSASTGRTSSTPRPRSRWSASSAATSTSTSRTCGCSACASAPTSTSSTRACSARTPTPRRTSRIPTTSTRSCRPRPPPPSGRSSGSTSYPLIDEDRRRTARFAAERPDLTALTDAELVARARWFVPELDNGFARHDYASLASTIGPSILAGLCASIGEPDLQLELISGLGDVDSASPSWGLWSLSREANASPEITALFDEGPDAVLAAIADPQTDATRALRRVVRDVHARVRLPRPQRVGHPRAVVGGRPAGRR